MTKESLKQYRRIIHEIDNLLQRVDECHEQALKDYYMKKIFECENTTLEIEKAIDTLPSDKRQLMRHRYIDGWSWAKIDRELSISESTSKRWHKESIKKICDK